MYVGLISELRGVFNVRKGAGLLFHPFIFWSIKSEVVVKVTVRWSRLGTDDKLARTGSTTARKRMTWQVRADEKD
jgi:hypothetical protein